VSRPLPRSECTRQVLSGLVLLVAVLPGCYMHVGPPHFWIAPTRLHPLKSPPWQDRHTPTHCGRALVGSPHFSCRPDIGSPHFGRARSSHFSCDPGNFAFIPKNKGGMTIDCTQTCELRRSKLSLGKCTTFCTHDPNCTTFIPILPFAAVAMTAWSFVIK
jgi:hypothetical protein